MGRPSSSRRGRSISRHSEHSKFTTFVSNVLTRAEVTLPTLLVSLVYINRAKPHLQIALEEWACERVFLGAIMVASKVHYRPSHVTNPDSPFLSQFSNDSTLKNVHWALCTGVFGKRDVGRIEREFLDVLDFDLSITEDDILNHHDGLSSVALPSHDFRRLADYTPSHPHTHAHYPRSHHAHCPDLDPSSPQSSSSGSSPAPLTPEALANASFNPVIKSHNQAMELVVPPPAPKKSHHTSSTLDLLRAFPLPIPNSNSLSHPSASHKSHNRYSHFPYNNPVIA